MVQKPLLVIFIGVPGSGKTYFGSRLADKIDAMRLNSDAMRMAIFGSVDALTKVYHSKQRPTVNTYTFGAMDYAAKQILATGRSVIYEAIQQKKADRRHMEALADECHAKLVLVSMKVDEELAIQRTTQREAKDDSRKFDEKKAREVVTHFRDTFQPLERTDYVVEISGVVPFEDQYKSFCEQLAKIR